LTSTPIFARFSTVAGERGAADAERDIRGFALKFYTEEGNWDLVGNNTPVFFFRDPLRFPDLNHAIKRHPRTGMRDPDMNWDFWTLLPEALHQVTIVMSERGIPKSFRHMHGFGMALPANSGFSRTLRAVWPCTLALDREETWTHVHGALPRVVFPAVLRSPRASGPSSAADA
jgi:hypothetical protein